MMTRTIRLNVAVAIVLLMGVAPAAYAAGGDPIKVPTKSKPPKPSAEERYNEGLALAKQGDWPAAEVAYRDAIRMKPDLPEAWNGLGHTLKNLDRLDESVHAYHEALRLRPNYAQALEYLGEAYMRMGNVEAARSVLTRLAPLDEKLAGELAQVILTGTAKW